MKRTWIWILSLLLLTGCGGTETAVFLPEETSPREAPPVYEQIRSTGEDLLLLAPGKLFRYAPDPPATTAEAEVASSFAGLQVREKFISYFDPEAGETVLLTPSLREVRRIPAPMGLTGIPLLSGDGETLFYCTEEAVWALDLGSGISRRLREDPAAGKTLLGLLMNDQVLLCAYRDPTLGERLNFLSAQTGEVLLDREAELEITALDDRYYAHTSDAHIFGTGDARPMALTPENPLARVAFLPQCHGAVSWFPEEDGIRLHYYDLSSGRRTASLVLPGEALPGSFCATGEGTLWFLRGGDLCSWDPRETPVEDKSTYTAPYYTAQSPDLEGLERCRLEAQRIGSHFGIRVLVWTDAAEVQPPDYRFTPEHRVEVLRSELRLLEERLARYPAGFLPQLGALRLCLVRSITPTPDNTAGSNALGLHFRSEGESCLMLTTGEGSEQTLYHELCHLIDSRVLTHSGAYDNWDSLNPGDFRYDYSYETNKDRDGSPFLQETSRSFIDTYSMSFPAEDRARIMEYAMVSGNAQLFSPPILQQKLTKICLGIREAFGLSEYPPLPWEQYLLRPVAPASRE